MLRKKNQLKLNSYKIDTNSLQTSLKQLSEIKCQLQTTIQYYKEHESQLLQENERLKQQIQILQNKTEVKTDHSSCQIKILKLEAELKQFKKEADKSQRFLENQKKNKEIIVKQYENKLEQEMKESRIKVDKYLQRIADLEIDLKKSKIANQIEVNQNKALKQQLEESVKTLKMLQSKRQEPKRQFNNYNLKSDSDGESTKNIKQSDKLKEQKKNYDKPKYDSEYIKQQPSQKTSLNGMPPKSPNSLANRQFKSSHEVRESSKPENIYSHSAAFLNSEEEQIFSASVRKLYNQVKDMGLSSRQIQILPQFKKMKENSNPSKKDLINFFKNPPFEEENEKNIMKSANYLENIVKNQHGRLSGKFITQLVIARVQQYENSSKLKTEDLEISGMTPSMSKQGNSNYEFAEQKGEQYRNYSLYDQYVNRSKPSIRDHLRIESENSIF